MKRTAPLLAIAMLLAGLARAEASPETDFLEVEADIALPDGGTLSVGQPFTLIIEARHTRGRLALLPETLDLGGEVAERRSARAHTRTATEDAEIDRYALELIAFSKGAITIPEIPLAMGATTASTHAMRLEIGSNFTGDDLLVATSTRPEAAAELERMAAQNPPPRALVVDDYRPLWAGGAAIAALAIAFALWRLSKRPKRAPEAPPVPPRPAHEIAMERFAALRSSGLLEAGEVKAFMTELSEILRAYAGGRYGFESLELTLDELMAVLSRKHTPSLDLGTLQGVLLLADQVKFAKLTPSVEECRQACDISESLVRVTASPPKREVGGDPGEVAA